MPTEIVSTLDWVRDAGTIGLLIVIILGGAKQWWVFGYQYLAMQADRDYYRTIAFRLLNVAERSTKDGPV